MRAALVPILGLVAATACGSPSSSSGTTPDAGVAALAYTPCAADARVGSFTVRLADGFSAVEGRVFDGVVPANVRAVTATEGSCRILEGRNLFCDPACGASETCGEDGTCIAYPRAQSAGAVTVGGLKAELTMEPSSVAYYSNGATSLPHPAFDEGAAITLSAAGDAVEAFTLEGVGITALAGAPTELELAGGQDLHVTWTPGGVDAARVRLVLDLAHHGGIAASMECDALPDDGAFDVPAALVDALLDIGVAGFPTITMSRRTEDSTTLSVGCVELGVVSEVVGNLTVPGVVSCASDDDCSAGETCRDDLTCG